MKMALIILEIQVNFLFLERMFFADLNLMQRRLTLYENILKQGIKVEAIFMTAEAVKIASRLVDDEVLKIQDSYLSLKEKFTVDLLVCGRAFKEQGYDSTDLKEGFILSGNMEMLALAFKAQKIIEL